MASLETLPIELFEEILETLSLSDMSRLSRVTRGLHALLSPRVYVHIDLHWEPATEAPPLHLLLRTLLSNPNKARHIKSLRLSGGIVPFRDSNYMWPCSDGEEAGGYYDNIHELSFWDGSGWQPIPRASTIFVGSSFSLHDLQRLKHAVSAIHRPEPSIWMHELRRGNIDVLVALILGQLPSLTELGLGFRYLHHAQFIPAMIRHKLIEESIQNAAQFMTSLTTVEMALDAPDFVSRFWADLDLFRPFFFARNIESFQASLTEPWLFAWPGIRPRCHSLTTLVLVRAGIMEDTLNKLLSATPALKHLTYDHARETVFDEHSYRLGIWNQVRCWRLNMALAHVKTTLETLVIRVTFLSDEGLIPDLGIYPVNPCGISGRLTILKEMYHLKRLEIPWEVLFGWDTGILTYWSGSLPLHLQRLSLRNDSTVLMRYEWIEDVTFARAAQLVGCCHNSFKDLRYFTIIYRCGTLGRHDKRLLPMFRNKGITFNYILEYLRDAIYRRGLDYTSPSPL